MPGYRWVHCSGGDSMPEGAVIGGRDEDGDIIFVGRANHGNDKLPAKVLQNKNVAYICYNGQEHPKSQFEVLCYPEPKWVFARNGEVPHNAMDSGLTADGETLYTGRVLHRGSQTIGKVHPSHNCLYIPFGGEELSFNDYEVLVNYH